MSVLERMPVDRIGEQARQVRLGRTLAQLVAVLLVGTGWTARMVCRGAWFAMSWTVVAVKVGWQDAAPKAVQRR